LPPATVQAARSSVAESAVAGTLKVGANMALERLQKLLARAGFGSRRSCEELITAGRVTVGGHTVTELGAKADLGTQDVRLDGQRIRPQRVEYWILNKPKDVVCTNLDPAGRPRPIDLMTGTRARLFPVGRLDADSRGLLLMTNDGEFANRLAHPRYEVPKTYVATVAGELTRDDIGRLIRGVWLAEGRTRRAEVRLLKRGHARSIVEVTLREGRNRQIRRVLAKLGHNVRELVRSRVGRISLRGLRVGGSRRLTQEEVEYLRKLPDEPPRAIVKGAREGRREGRREDRRRGRPEGPRRRREGRPERPPRASGGDRQKRSSWKHDSGGVGQAGQGDRRHADRRGGGRRGPRGGLPRRGGRPHHHPGQ